MGLISAITPISTDGSRGEEIRRRLEQALRSHREAGFEHVVGDSSLNNGERNRELCERYGAVWVDARRSGPFSPGYARDAAAMRASGGRLWFYDVDLAMGPGFLDRLKEAAKSLHPLGPGFTMVPCLYLDRSASGLVARGAASVDGYWKNYLSGDFTGIINLASASSAIMVGRNHFLALGGHREEFAGHGCEDLDLILRLTIECPTGRIGPDVSIDRRQESIAESEGFRKYFTYRGIDAGLDRLALAHLWHRRELTSRYRLSHRANENLFPAFIDRALNHGGYPEPLPDLNVPGLAFLQRGRGAPDPLAFPWLIPGLGRRTQDAGEATRVLRTLAGGEEGDLGVFPAAAEFLTLRAAGEEGGDRFWRLTATGRGGDVRSEWLLRTRTRTYEDGVSTIQLPVSRRDLATGAEDAVPVCPDQQTLPPPVPLEGYIEEALRARGLDRAAGAGFYRNQWAGAPAHERIRRKLVKLLTNPRRFLVDAVRRGAR